MAEVKPAWSSTSWDEYHGTKRELIAVGICKPEWFPAKLEIITNYRKPKVRRTYEAEGKYGTVRLEQKTDKEGKEYWVVRVAVSPQERARREKEERKAWEEGERRDEERQRKRDQERNAALPLLMKMRDRYPTIEGWSGQLVTRDDGTRQQSIEFFAPLDELKRLGFVTDEMLRKPKPGARYFHGDLGTGERFFLSENRPGQWCLTIHTPEVIRERKHFPVTEARRLLKEIAAK